MRKIWVEAEKVLAEFEVALIALGARSKEHAPQFSRSNP